MISGVNEAGASEAEPRISLSACIIVRDEATNLKDCLAALDFCQEVVLVDSGSTDGTVQIARAAGARVIEHPWQGFAAQRNVALDSARGEWALEVDADERVSPRLQAEIKAFVADPPPGVDIAGLPLRDMLLGHPLGPSAKYPKYRHRLFRRGAYRHDERRTVHEGLVPHGPVHPFEGDLVHLLAVSWREAVGDMWAYARLEAGQLRAPRTPASVLKGALLRPTAKLLYRLTIDGGWRDGLPGVAKITLDCTGDALVWLRYMAGARGTEHGESGVQAGQHYGAWKQQRGSLRVVGVACGTREVGVAERWLERAATCGGDVALVAAHAPGARVRVRCPEGTGPAGVIRALAAEEQLRTIDGVVAFGTRARLMLRLAPGELRGHMRDLTAAQDPATVGWDGSARGEQGAP
jgi:hypothetical protein